MTAAQGIVGLEFFLRPLSTTTLLRKTTITLRHLRVSFLLRVEHDPFWLGLGMVVVVYFLLSFRSAATKTRGKCSMTYSAVYDLP